jgi:hypothetical protein
MPSIAVPNAPIPVHTAYAVPSGISLTAKARRSILRTMLTKVKILGQNLVNPLEYFNPTAQQISKMPAIKSINQCINFII